MISINGRGNLITKSSSKVTIKSSITIMGTGTELPIEITADFENIPPHLHQCYIQSMMSSYGSVNTYDNTKEDETLSISPEILYKEKSKLKTLIFGLFKKL